MRKLLQFGFVLLLLISTAKITIAQNEPVHRNYYSFGGHVFSGDFPIKLGYAYLYNNENLSTAIDTAIIDTLGYYYFYRKLEGDYLVFAGLDVDDPNYGHFAYSYYPNGAYWGDAGIIHLNETNWEYDIKLINLESEDQSHGPGIISGSIVIHNGKPFASNVDVMICNEQMEPLMHWPTNSQGEFFFNNLDYGNYYLYPQVTGLITEPLFFSITNDQTEVNDVEITIKNGYINSYINEELINNQTFYCFPNPASNVLNINFDSKSSSQMNIHVYDLQGRLVYEIAKQASQGLNWQQIDTSEWGNGFYFLDISLNKQSAVKYKFAVVQ